MKLKPTSDHIVIKTAPKEEITAAGIIIPDTVDKERAERGEVVAVGPGRSLDGGGLSEINVLVGQTVLFKKYAPDEVKIDGQEYLIIRFDDVMAVIEN
jgi:chaperonin GroES